LDLTLTLEKPEKPLQLFGTTDSNLRMTGEFWGVHVSAGDGRLRLSGNEKSVSQAAALVESMQNYLRKHEHIDKKDMLRLINETAVNKGLNEGDKISVYIHGRFIEARSAGQKQYIEAMEKTDMVFCAGPAGTGKTYLAVAMAVSMLKKNCIRRIILARPAVEAGEKLGFLPGDMQAKVNPYLRPLFDALGDMMEYSQIKQFVHNDVIEVVPLAFMRGRTLNDAVVILDEAQNTTVGQMLMFLTRMGHDSKMIITGDDSQTDLADDRQSGLNDAIIRLKGIKGISFVRLKEVDIVRHRLVQSIVRAYDRSQE